MVAKSLPSRQQDGYKGDFGRVLCIGGTYEMAGAITLASKAALYSGAGLVTVATDARNFPNIHSSCLELMCIDYKDRKQLTDQIQAADTILIGPGMGRTDFAADLFNDVLATVKANQFLVIDADGLYHLSQLKGFDLPEKTVITPHLGEWERLSHLNPDQENPADNQVIRDSIGATLVLKSDRTEVYTKDQIYKNTAGNPGMAVGGMGDTLAGMVTGMVKQFDQWTDAVVSAVFIHSYIGDQIANDQYIALPSQVIDCIPKTMKDLST